MSNQTKRCKVCRKNKPLSEYHKHNTAKFGVQTHCKECHSKRNKKWYLKNNKLAKQKNREFKLLREYGISIKEYDTILKEQNGNCKICGNKETLKRRLGVDHCHTTGKVRGLLCSKCNRGIGMFNDNIDNLNKAIKYLKEYI